MSDECRVYYRPGYEALSLWFGLSYSSWLTMPRVLMEAMPDEWQADMARLLTQWDDTWDTDIDGIHGTRVQITGERGKLIKTPQWVINYRRPHRDKIEQCRKPNPNAV